MRSSATYGARVAPCTASSTFARVFRTTVSRSDQSGSLRSIASVRANASDSSTNSTGERSRSAMPSSKASFALSSRFCRSGLRTMTRAAASGPISRGSSCVPPQPGMIDSATSGKPTWRTSDEIVRAVQWSASSSPPPRQAPLIAATVGNGSAWMRENSPWPARIPSRGSSTRPSSSMSAPTQNTNGLPVMTAAVQSPRSSSSMTEIADSKADRPSVVGTRWSSPLSIVTSATVPARRSLKAVSANALPEDRGAHSHADAERGEPVAALALTEPVGELGDEAHPCRRERVPAGDRTAVRIEPGVVRVDAELVAPRQHLDGERLVQLEDVDLVERDPRLLEHTAGGRDGADAHQVRLDAGVCVADEAEPRLEPDLVERFLGGEERRRRAVREPGRVAGGDAAAGTEGGLQPGESLHGRLGAQELVPLGELPAVVGEDGHRHDRLAHDAVRPCRDCLLLRGERERVRPLAGDRGAAVVEVLRRLAHDGRRLVDQPLGDEARVEVDVLAHRMVPHVLDAARDRDVGGAERDLARCGGDRRERARAHSVYGEAGDRLRDAGEERDVAAERQALVADLRRRGHDDVADALRREARVAAEELPDGLDGHVVGARAPELALRARLPERRSNAVDEVHLAGLAHD